MKVYVATYTHKHGNDMRVFKKRESAEKWRIELADEYWRDYFGENYKKPSDKEKNGGHIFSNDGRNGLRIL